MSTSGPSFAMPVQLKKQERSTMFQRGFSGPGGDMHPKKWREVSKKDREWVRGGWGEKGEARLSFVM